MAEATNTTGITIETGITHFLLSSLQFSLKSVDNNTEKSKVNKLFY